MPELNSLPLDSDFMDLSRDHGYQVTRKLLKYFSGEPLSFINWKVVKTSSWFHKPRGTLRGLGVVLKNIYIAFEAGLEIS